MVQRSANFVKASSFRSPMRASCAKMPCRNSPRGAQPGQRIEFGKTTDFTTEAHISEPAQSGIAAFTPLPKELAGDACAPVLALDQPKPILSSATDSQRLPSPDR